jgi:hypothetical protein
MSADWVFGVVFAAVVAYYALAVVVVRAAKSRAERRGLDRLAGRWDARRDRLVAERCSRTFEDAYWVFRAREADLACALGLRRVSDAVTVAYARVAERDGLKVVR